MKKLYKVGDFVFELECPEMLPIPMNFQLFETEYKTASYFYNISFSEVFPKISGEIIAERKDLLVLKENDLEKRYIGIKSESFYYAYSCELDNTHTQILLRETYLDNFSIDPIFTAMLSLEKHLLKHDAIILHCSYMERNGSAILFSAPSETGKTTQANLWKKYRRTDTVNGDRALLRRIEGSWHACGWPVCGSSEVCHNKEMPIEAIVMLSQAVDNSIIPLNPMQAFYQLYSQITINRWNTIAHNKAIGLIEELVTQVPIYHLACNISEDAVACLESIL